MLLNVSPDVAAVLLSILSLLVATASFIISWRVAARDRAGLTVSASYDGTANLGPEFRISVVNIGRRPITVDTVELISRDHRRSVYKEIGTPVPLQETDKIDLYFAIWHAKPLIRDPREFSTAIVRDTRGKEWSVSLRSLVKDIPDEELFKDKADRKPHGS